LANEIEQKILVSLGIGVQDGELTEPTASDVDDSLEDAGF
jgi:hypothetical protein